MSSLISGKKTTTLLFNFDRFLINYRHAFNLGKRYSSHNLSQSEIDISWKKKIEQNFKNSQTPYNILFMGTDEFSVGCLKYLIEHPMKDKFIKNIDIVCPSDKKTGKSDNSSIKMPLKCFAENKNLKIYEVPPEGLQNWEIPNTNLRCLKDSNDSSINPKSFYYDIVIVVSFGYYIPSRIIDSVRLAINIHPSLLPKYRGAAPIFHTLLNGDKITGTSVIDLSKKTMDMGRILYQENLFGAHFWKPYLFITIVTEEMDYGHLHFHLAILGGKGIVKVLEDPLFYVLNAKAQTGIPLLAPKIIRKDARIHWDKDTCQTIKLKYKAIQHKYSLHALYEDKIVKFMDIGVSLNHLNTVRICHRPHISHFHALPSQNYLTECECCSWAWNLST